MHYQIVGRVRIERKSDLLHSIGPIRPSSSFSILSPSSFFHCEHSLCPRPLPLLVFRRRTSFRNERHGCLPFSIPWTCDKFLFSRKLASVRAGRRMLWKSVLLGNSSRRESNARLSMTTRNGSISQKGPFRRAVNYMYINFTKFNQTQAPELQHDLIFLHIGIYATDISHLFTYPNLIVSDYFRLRKRVNEFILV